MPAPPDFDALQTEDLLVHVKQGDQDAWREVYRRYRVFLFNSARRIAGVGATQAEDVLQSAFLSAWKDIEGFSYRGQGSFRAWLEQIVVHKNSSKLQAQIRRADILRSRTVDSDVLRAFEDPSAKNPADSVLKSEEERRLRECMEEHLDDVAREIIVLRHLEGLSTRQVAEVVELNSEQVRRRYRAAMEKIARILGRGEADGT